MSGGDYGKVVSRFWTDPDVKILEPLEKLVTLYYFTSPHANMAGLYSCPPIYASKEIGVKPDFVEACLYGSLQKFLSFDWETEEVFVHRLATYRIGRELSSGDRRRVHLTDLLRQAHSRALVCQFLDVYADWALAVPGFNGPEPAPPDKGHGKPLPMGHHAKAEAETGARTRAGARTGAEAAGASAAVPTAARRADHVLQSAAAAAVPTAGQPMAIAYLPRCVIALNRGLRANPLVARADRQPREISSSECAGDVTWEADGIPVAIAERVVEAKARAYRPTPRSPQPHGLRYFDSAVRDAFEREQAAGAVRTAPPSAGARPIRRVSV